MLKCEIRERIKNTNKYDDVRKANISRMATRIDRYSDKYKINVRDMDTKDVENIIREIGSVSMSSVYQYIQHTRDVFSLMNIDTDISTTTINPLSVIKDTKDRYFTKSEIQDVCDLLLNPQDKFIIYGLFCGIYGKANEDLLNLKVTDIDFKNKEINVNGHKIKMDNYMYNLLEDVLDPVFGATYYRYVEEDTKYITGDSYELNFNCPYVIKSKPYARNNNGLEKMKPAGMRRRLDMLNKYTGYNLASIDLVRSGIMYRMNKIQKTWTVAEIEDFLKKNNFKMKTHELYRIYNLKYLNN